METMNCGKFESLIDPYLDGELDQLARRSMDAHARNCPACGARLDMATKLMTMCAELDEGLQIPLDAQASWRKAVREEAKARKKRGAGSLVVRLGTLAAALVVLVGGTMMFRSGSLPLSLNGETNQTQMADTLTVSRAPMVAPMAGNAKMLDLSEEPGYNEQDQGEDSFMVDGQSADTPSGADAQAGQRKLIRSASRTIETSNFEADLQNIREMIDRDFGDESYEESFEQGGKPLSEDKNGGRYASLVARIQTDELDAFLSGLDGAFSIIEQDQNAYDVSSNYHDTQARLAAQKAKRDRLTTLMATATAVSDVVEIERELANAQAEIDAMEGQLKGWDSQVNLSRVYLSVREAADRTSVQPINTGSWAERMKASFTESINVFFEFVQDMAVFLALVWPWILILVVLLIVVRASVKRRRARGA